MRNAILSIFCLILMLASGNMAMAQDSEFETSETVTGTATVTSFTNMDVIESGKRPRIAVYTFDNPPAYYNSTIGTGLTDIITTYLVQSGRFNVIQRGENLGLIIDEINLGRSGYIENETAIEMGHVLGVEYILSGRVTNFGYEETSLGGFINGADGLGDVDITEEKAFVRIDFCLIDAITGETMLAAAANGRESELGIYISGSDWDDWLASISWDTDEFMDSMVGQATLNAVDNLMEQLLVLFPVQASIIAVTPDFLILDIGINAGIEEGMEFEVYRVVAITNEAGDIVWEDHTLLGVVEVSEVDLTSCKAAIMSGSEFMEGDLCILPEDEISREDAGGNLYRN